MLTAAENRFFRDTLREILKKTRLSEMKQYLSHSDITAYTHSVKVAYTAYRFAIEKGITCDLRALVRGGLLHDYYLYDWHDPNKGFRWHGFKHHRFALRNAERDLPLTRRERNIIHSHMFPLTFWALPRCIEAWLVTLADKVVASEETVKKYRK